MALISTLVEGELDLSVATKLLLHTKHEVGTAYGRGGFGYIKKTVSGFSRVARGGGANYLALVDFMDTRCDCPAAVVSEWIGESHKNMVFRVVMREIESWLLADSQAIASFLQVSVNKIPSDVDRLTDPKQTLINIARSSKSSIVRKNLVPAKGSTAREGTLYTSEMMRFIDDKWDVSKACKASPSLEKCIVRLNQLN